MHTILIDGANSYDYVKARAHSKSSRTAFVFSLAPITISNPFSCMPALGVAPRKAGNDLTGSALPKCPSLSPQGTQWLRSEKAVRPGFSIH